MDSTAAAIPPFLRILQFSDSTFPVGGFAFSAGLEMAVQRGVVHDRASLAEFTHTVAGLAATGDGVALLAAHRGAVVGDLDRIRQADEAVYIRKLSEEARTMTVRMGRKFAEAAQHIVGDSVLDRRFRAAATDSIPVTYPVALGALLASLGMSEEDAFGSHQYGVAAMVLNAALRLMRIGHLDTQAILYAVDATVADKYQQAAQANLEDMATFGPVIDVLAAMHVRAHVRLFMS